MEVVAFVGPSGTGKSHHAIGVAFDNRCDAIIDDAKNEDNRIQAVKRAIFTDEGHAQAVREALATNNIHRLLIIATSDNMINKIIGRLKLDKPVKTVYINQIASKAEIKKARHARLQEGKHIVPVPTIELKPHFTGYFADLPYNIFSSQRKQEKDADRSIVRPSFSFYGKLLISDSALEDIIKIIGRKLEGVERITSIKVRRRSDNSKGIVISVEVVLYYGVKLFAVTKQFQAKIKEKIEYMTAMKVNNVNVSIRSLAVKK